MRQRNAALSITDEALSASHHDGKDYPQQEQEQRHQLTSADLAQLEQEARNKQAEKEQA